MPSHATAPTANPKGALLIAPPSHLLPTACGPALSDRRSQATLPGTRTMGLGAAIPSFRGKQEECQGNARPARRKTYPDPHLAGGLTRATRRARASPTFWRTQPADGFPLDNASGWREHVR